ncbi:hypothetical protein [Sphingobium baderi]|uniref:hypothetical protein n=1 Tax=Sphingobium baderi TaxID=1332080 RepID=UPI001F24958E|nr:hypothetical protein [Sphingobium baderi]
MAYRADAGCRDKISDCLGNRPSPSTMVGRLAPQLGMETVDEGREVQSVGGRENAVQHAGDVGVPQQSIFRQGAQRKAVQRFFGNECRYGGCKPAGMGMPALLQQLLPRCGLLLADRFDRGRRRVAMFAIEQKLKPTERQCPSVGNGVIDAEVRQRRKGLVVQRRHQFCQCGETAYCLNLLFRFMIREGVKQILFFTEVISQIAQRPSRGFPQRAQAQGGQAFLRNDGARRHHQAVHLVVAMTRALHVFHFRDQTCEGCVALERISTAV